MAKNIDTICFSLSEELLKIVHTRGVDAKAKVVNLNCVSVKGVSSEELPKLILSAVKKFPLKKSNLALMAPAGAVTSKNIEIPSVDEDEIQSIVDLQAARHTPFSREEIEIGFINIGIHNQNFTKVLLTIANRALLKEQISTFEKAGVRIEKVLFAPEGVGAIYASHKTIAKSAEPVAFLNLDHQKSDFLILHGSKVITSRVIPLGRSQIEADREAAMGRLIEELTKTLESYRNEEIGQTPAKYFLCADDQANKEIAKAVNEKLGWSVEFAPYVNFIKISRATLKQMAEQFAKVSFLDIIASSAHCSKSIIDLIPEDVHMQKAIEEQGREIFKAALVGIIILVLIGAALGLRIHFHNAYLNKLTSEYQDLRSEVDDVKYKAQRNKHINGYLSTRMDSLDIIQELYKYIPKNVYLSRIIMNEDGSVNIQGVSEIGSVVYNLNKTLKESTLFKSADVKSKKAKKDRGKDAHAFEIVLTFNELLSEEVETP